jgi:hypothetical protein
MNEKTIFESQEKQIASLSERVETSQDSILTLAETTSDLNYFTLLGNENAMTYFEKLGFEAAQVQNMVSEAIYEKNVENGGNSLIQVAGTDGIMRVNKLKFLNHRWIVADFSDGSNWGEMIIEYFFDENNNLQLTTIGTVLYPK